MSEQLLEALRRGLGAQWVRVLDPKAPAPEEERRGFLRRSRVHLLRVDVPFADPRRFLVCALDHEPTTEETLLAGAVARAIAPSRAERPRPTERRQLRPLVEALARSEVERPDAILKAAMRLTGAPAGGLARSEQSEAIWVEGLGRPVLRRAAREAARGVAGQVTVEGRTFLAVPARVRGRLVAGLALEDAEPSAELELFVAAAGASLDRDVEIAADTPSADDVRTIVAALRMPAFAVDRDGNLSGVSRDAEGLLTLSADFDVGLPVGGKLKVKELEDAAAGRTVSGTVTIAERSLELNIVRLPSGGRAILLRDRTQEQNLERVQEDLVASVAHELRTPVAAVQGLVQLLSLRAGKLDADTMSGLLADGQKEIARLERLVEDLLLAARISTGGITASKSDVELAAVAHEVVHRAGERYPSHSFHVFGDAEAEADPALFRHALWHLVDNAAKYGAADGEVNVEIRTTDQGPEVNVHDEGEGIYSGDIPNLFRRFRQIDATSTRAVGGAGLGLFLVKEVVEAQGGRVSVKSRLGKGSTFTIHLPPPSA